MTRSRSAGLRCWSASTRWRGASPGWGSIAARRPRSCSRTGRSFTSSIWRRPRWARCPSRSTSRIQRRRSATCCPDPRQVLSYVPQVRPTWFFAVPRIWEKLKAGLETMQAAQPEDQRRPVQEALAAAIERLRLRQRGQPVPEELEAKVALADEQVFSKVRALLGLDQAVAVNSGAGP